MTALQTTTHFGVHRRLAGPLGVAPGWDVTLLGFSKAVDEDVPGATHSNDPTRWSGVISWLSETADVAVGDYVGETEDGMARQR